MKRRVPKTPLLIPLLLLPFFSPFVRSDGEFTGASLSPVFEFRFKTIERVFFFFPFIRIKFKEIINREKCVRLFFFFLSIESFLSILRVFRYGEGRAGVSYRSNRNI